jgi:hypothetical protein
MIFARDLNDPLTSLVKKIDAATVKNTESKMGSFVVFLNDDEDIEKKLKDLGDKEHLSKIALTTMSNKSGPEAYKIAKDAEVTVVLYSKNKCEATYAFKKGEMTESDVDKIVADVAKIVPKD